MLQLNAHTLKVVNYSSSIDYVIISLALLQLYLDSY